jgi:glutathione S-transferase
MRCLYHLLLSPFCRKVRLVLGEKGLDFDMKVERTWERRPEFIAINPAGQVPVLIDDDGAAVVDSNAICEYLEEVYPDRGARLLGASAVARAEVRRLLAWFDVKFYREVTANLVGEKIQKRLLGSGPPDSNAIRAGHANIHTHLDYIAWLTERRSWLAGDNFSLADIAAASHLSCLDYIGDVPWDDHRGARDWYARIKSRKTFRPILADHIPGVPPPKHYADPDF